VVTVAFIQVHQPELRSTAGAVMSKPSPITWLSSPFSFKRNIARKNLWKNLTSWCPPSATGEACLLQRVVAGLGLRGQSWWEKKTT